MKKGIYILAMLVNLTALAQKLEIPAESFPFYDIIEWKSMGAILVNRDPSGTPPKIYMTFVSNQNTPVWKESYNPSGKESYYIWSEGARYIYFLDNVLLNKGKCYFSQINTAGNIKSSTSEVLYALKKLKPAITEDIELVDVVTTDKALLHIFRYHDKKEKKIIDMVVSMTHHNLALYAGILGETQEEMIKNKSTNGWFYVGSTGEQLYFATRDVNNKKKGFTVKEYNTHMESKISQFLPDYTGGFENIENTGFGNTGKNYFKHENPIEPSILTQYNSNFYLTGLTSDGSGKVMQTYIYKYEAWEIVKSSSIGPNSKQAVKVGILPLNEGFAIRTENASKTTVNLQFFEKNRPTLISEYNANYVNNPSRYLTEEHKGEFCMNVPSRVIYFNRNQLNKAGSVIFEYLTR